MSQTWSQHSPGVGPVLLVSAATGDEAVTLDRITPGRSIIVRRTDSSTVYRVTVAPPTGLPMDGTVDATKTVGPDSERTFYRSDAGFESIGADASVLAPAAAAPVASAATSGTLTAGAEHNLSPASAAAWTLPTGVSASAWPTTVKNNGTATLTIARGGSDTINGGTTSVTLAAGEWARFVSNGAGAWTQSGTAGQSGTYARLNYAGTAIQFASANAATAGAGAVYYVTDTGAQYRSNGSAWVLVVSPPATESLRASVTAGITNVYYPGLLTTQVRTVTPTVGDLLLTPCYTDYAITIDSLAVNVSSGVATALYRMGVFTAGNQAFPFATNVAALLNVDGGTVDCSTSGDKAVTFTAITIPAKTWFFVGGCAQTAAATMTVEGNAGLRGWSPLGIIGGSTTLNAAPSIALKQTSITGAFPGSLGTSLGVVNVGSGVTYRVTGAS